MIDQALRSLLAGVPVGLQLGATGTGGATLGLPLMVYLAGIPMQQAAAMSLTIVATSSLLGAWPDSIQAGEECQSYMHFGQHGGADYYGIINKSRNATVAESAALLCELTRIGYDDLVVYKRAQRWMHDLRFKTMQEEA